MDIVERVLRKELKDTNGRLKDLRNKRDKNKAEGDALATQIDQLQIDKQTYLAAMQTLGYTTE